MGDILVCGYLKNFNKIKKCLISLNVKKHQYDYVLNFIAENNGEILQNDILGENWINMFIRFNDEDKAEELMYRVAFDIINLKNNIIS